MRRCSYAGGGYRVRATGELLDKTAERISGIFNLEKKLPHGVILSQHGRHYLVDRFQQSSGTLTLLRAPSEPAGKNGAHDG